MLKLYEFHEKVFKLYRRSNFSLSYGHRGSFSFKEEHEVRVQRSRKNLKPKLLING